MTDEASTASASRRFIWDWPTRIFHWAIVGLIAGLWWTSDNRVMDVHRLLGQAMLGLLVFRIYWGLFGTRSARFSDFLKWPADVVRYVRSLFQSDYQPATGHNPLGGLSVFAMLLVLSAQVTLGLFAVDVDGLESGPLARHVSFDTGRAASDLHDTLFDVLLWLIVLHLAAIAFYQVFKRADLIGPMVTGHRQSSDKHPATLAPAPAWRILPGVALAGLVVWLVVN